MGMQHERDGRVGALAVLVASFKSAFRPVEDHVRHRLFFLSFGNQPAQGGQENLPLWPKETGCRGPAAHLTKLLRITISHCIAGAGIRLQVLGRASSARLPPDRTSTRLTSSH